MADKKTQLVEKGESLIRILGRDISGNKKLYPGLTKIKGVSWAVSKATCLKLGLDKDKRIGELSKAEIEKIEKFLQNADLPVFLVNRRSDYDTGGVRHLTAVDLDMRKEFDIKRLKKIKSYRGMRHAFGLPTRGQKTRSHFRKGGRAVGVKKPKAGKKS